MHYRIVCTQWDPARGFYDWKIKRADIPYIWDLVGIVGPPYKSYWEAHAELLKLRANQDKAKTPSQVV